MNSSVSFDLVTRYLVEGSFAGIQFPFCYKCYDSIPFLLFGQFRSILGAVPFFISLMRFFYTHMTQHFRYAGCLGSPW